MSKQNKTTKREISDYLKTEYKNYAFYVIEGRAVPSVVDGFKPVQRKIIHIANKTWKTGNEKAMKVFQLTGKIANEAFYHHGDASLNGAVVSMVQSFKNNLPLLKEDGQYGSLRSPEAGAPRYIGTKLSPNFKMLYKDFELLTPKLEEGYEIEPQFFLPIIPTVLINGGSGIAVGYSSNILNRKPLDIINACLTYLKEDKVGKLKPYLNGFKIKYTADKEVNNRWIAVGNYEIVNSTTIRITELPPSMTYEKWETLLDKLVDDKKIKSYEDNSKDNIDYTIKLSKEDLEKMTSDETKLVSLFKLSESFTEYFTTLDETGKLKIFDSAEDIVRYFVKFRLGYYELRKSNDLKKMTQLIKGLENKAKFINAVINNEVIINKKSKADITKQIEAIGIDKKDDSYDYLLRIPVSSFTKEQLDKLKEEQKNLKVEYKKIKDSVPKDTYIQELEELKKEI